MTIAKILVGLPSSMEIFKESRWRAHLPASLPDLPEEDIIPMLRRSVATIAYLLNGLSASQSFPIARPIMTEVSRERGQSADIASTTDPFAEELGEKLNSTPVYLTESSWYILVKGWMPSTPSAFQEEWDLHPEDRHPIKMFGRVVYEKRWSQSWGVSYSYSGGTNVARSVEESSMIPMLLQKANELTDSIQQENAYNGCLQNWYLPEDTIGLHADDEKVMRKGFPIFSLSWGGTRRFLFRPRDKSKEKVEIWLNDGDLLVMGGTCQETHQHEVPKRRVTMDPQTSNRINWTIRAFRTRTSTQAQRSSQRASQSKMITLYF